MGVPPTRREQGLYIRWLWEIGILSKEMCATIACLWFIRSAKIWKNNTNKKIKRYHESGDALQGSGLTHFLSFWGPLPYIKEGPIIISSENLFWPLIISTKVFIDTKAGGGKVVLEMSIALMLFLRGPPLADDKETLPKAQRTRGLRPYHKFLHKIQFHNLN